VVREKERRGVRARGGREGGKGGERSAVPVYMNQIGNEDMYVINL
jgi:hypothetical protein